MLEGSTDLLKRKPRRLRGTPANRAVNLISFSVVSIVAGFFYLLNVSDAEWSRARKKRIWERIKPTEEEAVRRDMFQDQLYASAVRLMKERQAVKLDLEYEQEISGEAAPKTDN